jgi:hypothetical protein
MGIVDVWKKRKSAEVNKYIGTCLCSNNGCLRKCQWFGSRISVL